MDVFEAIKWRRSVRKFSPQPIEKERLLQILEAARLAPSSSNRQAWHFVVIDDKKVLEQIPKQVAMGDRLIIPWIKDAPVVIAGCYAKALSHYIGQIFDHENFLIDISIALTHMVLAATELGIGTCYIGWFNQKKLRSLLGIPSAYKIACLVAMGYPAEKSTLEGIGGISPRARKDLKEIVSYNKFGAKL
ncbi:MAG TPA: nitroreductase family protein [bacterium]|jgi:nitroreductase